MREKKEKTKCFWCNKYFVDLIKQSERMQPKLNTRTYGETKK